MPGTPKDRPVCPRCACMFFRRVPTPGGGQQDICEECCWPGPDSRNDVQKSQTGLKKEAAND